jgi:serine/threonine-protein kinase
LLAANVTTPHNGPDDQTGPHEAAVSREPAIPAIPGYEVLEVLSKGGMGVVYRARHNTLSRDVALKVLQGGGMNLAGSTNRLQQEALLLARLEHPGIVPVYAVGACEGQAFIAMKLVEGASLAARLGALRASLPRAIALLAWVARAVQHAHEQGVVYRDLKPANILLDAQGAAFVTDFGVALRLDADARLTASGAVMGTPAYMAPEQATGERSVGPAADVWALGVILYELLTGRIPFAGATPLETLHRVVRAEPPPMDKEVQGWPRVLEGVCLRCLQQGPARRYPSASDLADDLDRWLRHEQPKDAARRPRRLRLPVPGKRALYAVLVVGALALWVFDRDRIAQGCVLRVSHYRRSWGIIGRLSTEQEGVVNDP